MASSAAGTNGTSRRCAAIEMIPVAMTKAKEPRGKPESHAPGPVNAAAAREAVAIGDLGLALWAMRSGTSASMSVLRARPAEGDRALAPGGQRPPGGGRQGAACVGSDVRALEEVPRPAPDRVARPPLPVT